MKKSILILTIAIIGSLTACGKKVDPPQPYGVVPTEQQLAWQKMEYYMFIHFGPNTFSNVEWGNGKEDPKIFAPTDVDCRQWAATAKAAGMKAIILTAKHHDGFCLWPSAYSKHTVRESGWKDGKGDLLKELSEACAEYGLKFGVYLSPWDRNHPTYGTPAYNEVFVNTLTEVLSNYGPVFEQWFDGANGEGHNGKKQEYDWTLFNGTVYKLQPDAVIFSDVGPGCRWIGNERGIAGTTNWSRLDTEGFEPGLKAPSPRILNSGQAEGSHWVPGEADVSIRPGWFYSPETDDKVKSINQLMEIYYSSVGRNANLLLNVPPDRRGRIHPNDSVRLMQFREAVEGTFKTDLTASATITADNVRGGSSHYSAANMLIHDYDSYWAADDTVTTATLTLTLKKPAEFNHLVLQEYIPLGQRIAKFDAEYLDDASGEWKPLAEATTIGYKRILTFPAVTASQVRVNITESLACPVLNRIGLYYSDMDFDQTIGGEVREPVGTAGLEYTIVSPAGTDMKAAFDANSKTIARVPVSESIVLDLGKERTIKGFGYIPDSNVETSNIMRYSFYTSADGQTWEQVFSNAMFDNMKNNPSRRDIIADKPAGGRYVKLVAEELTNPGDMFSIAELGIITE